MVCFDLKNAPPGVCMMPVYIVSTAETVRVVSHVAGYTPGEAPAADYDGARRLDNGPTQKNV